MDEDFDSGFDAEVCDTDDLSVETPMEDLDGDDVGAWMDEVPEAEEQPVDVLEEPSVDLAPSAEEELDISALMDSAGETVENVSGLPEEIPADLEPQEVGEEPDLPEEIPSEAPEAPADLEPQEAGEEPDLPEETPVETPEAPADLEPQEVGEAPDLPEEIPVETPEAPEGLEPQEAAEAPEAPEDLEPQEVGEEPDLPEETPVETPEAPENSELLEPSEAAEETPETGEGLTPPPEPVPPLPGQQELMDAWMEGEDPEDTIEDLWDTAPETGEDAGDSESGAADHPQETDSAESAPEGTAEDVTVPPVDAAPDAPPVLPETVEAAQALPSDTGEPAQPLDDMPVDAVSDIHPGTPTHIPPSVAPDGTTPPDSPAGLDEPLADDVSDSDNLPGAASALEQMNAYMEAHNYGRDDFSTYCQDPEWQRLNQQLLQEQEIPPTAAEQMNLYMAQHNYGLRDYPEYSQDPEWQRLNEAMQQDPDMPLPVLSYDQAADIPVDTPDRLPEGEPAAPFSPEVTDTVERPEEIPATATGYYEQGINDFGYEGTCGPTSIANGINRQLGTNAFTENDVLSEAIQEGLCYQDAGSPADSGGTTTDQFMELYEHMNELSGGKLDIQRYDFDQVLSMEEVARQLEEGHTVHVAVDADTLWNNSTAGLMGTPEVEKATDHWITVTGVERGENNEITGFHIIDSGGGVDYVDADTYQTMCYGSEDLHLTDPTCIVVSRKTPDLASGDVPPPAAADAPVDAPAAGGDAPAVGTADVPTGSPDTSDLEAQRPFFSEMDPDSQAAMERLSGEERAVYLQALREEPAVTSDVQAVTEAAGGAVEGLEHRIKTPASLEEKLHGRETTTDIHDVSDILRYTQTFAPEDLAEGTNNSLSLYEAKGYTVCDVRNTWEDDTNPYNGINVKLLSPGGQKLEVQFHTLESFAVKNGPMHQLYEAWRQLPEDSQEAMELQNRMFALSRQLQVPRNISEVRKR